MSWVPGRACAESRRGGLGGGREQRRVRAGQAGCLARAQRIRRGEPAAGRERGGGDEGEPMRRRGGDEDLLLAVDAEAVESNWHVALGEGSDRPGPGPAGRPATRQILARHDREVAARRADPATGLVSCGHDRLRERGHRHTEVIEEDRIQQPTAAHIRSGVGDGQPVQPDPAAGADHAVARAGARGREPRHVVPGTTDRGRTCLADHIRARQSAE